MVLVAISMVAIIAMAAMSIDLVTLYLAREEAQRTADTAALAAARIISVSGITTTGNPSANNWPTICGPNGWSTQAAQAVGAENAVGGQSVNVTVMYSDGSTSNPDCSTLGPAFVVNPMVTVQIVPASIPSFFSRIWGSTANSVSASATAEAFNPSGSDINGVAPNGNVTPVEPRCIKPWIVPNLDPRDGKCRGENCSHFVSLSDGTIQNPGVGLDGQGTTGIVGEQFSLFADCQLAGSNCTMISGRLQHPVANKTGTGIIPVAPNLEYLPGAVTSPIASVPSCASGGTVYEAAVAGCDQTTVYQCGQQVPVNGNPNMVDLSENPGGPSGDTATGLACALTNNPAIPMAGQDTLRAASFPFLPFAGDANPLKISGTPITNSNSIVSFPIYDETGNGGTINLTGTTTVTIVGFLQVFVGNIDQNTGAVSVTVLNVAGCGNGSSGTPNAAVVGDLPIPVRLITPH